MTVQKITLYAGPLDGQDVEVGFPSELSDPTMTRKISFMFENKMISYEQKNGGKFRFISNLPTKPDND